MSEQKKQSYKESKGGSTVKEPKKDGGKSDVN